MIVKSMEGLDYGNLIFVFDLLFFYFWEIRESYLNFMIFCYLFLNKEGGLFIIKINESLWYEWIYEWI